MFSIFYFSQAIEASAIFYYFVFRYSTPPIEQWIIYTSIIIDIITTTFFVYILSCSILKIYEILSLKYPKVHFFFKWSTSKGMVLSIFFLFFVILSLLSAFLRVTPIEEIYHLFSNQFFFLDILRAVSDYGSTILGLDDVNFIHVLSYGPQYSQTPLSKLPSFALSIIWWYLFACIILYITNRKQLNSAY